MHELLHSAVLVSFARVSIGPEYVLDKIFRVFLLDEVPSSVVGSELVQELALSVLFLSENHRVVGLIDFPEPALLDLPLEGEVFFDQVMDGFNGRFLAIGAEEAFHDDEVDVVFEDLHVYGAQDLSTCQPFVPDLVALVVIVLPDPGTL